MVSTKTLYFLLKHYYRRQGLKLNVTLCIRKLLADFACFFRSLLAVFFACFRCGKTDPVQFKGRFKQGPF